MQLADESLALAERVNELPRIAAVKAQNVLRWPNIAL